MIFVNTIKYQPGSAGGTCSPPATLHRLQYFTAYKIQNCHQGAPKWLTGSGKACTVVVTSFQIVRSILWEANQRLWAFGVKSNHFRTSLAKKSKFGLFPQILTLVGALGEQVPPVPLGWYFNHNVFSSNGQISHYWFWFQWKYKGDKIELL